MTTLARLDRLTRLPLGCVTQLLEGRPLVVVDHQRRAPPHQVVDLPPLGDQWRPLVEGHLVDPERLAVVGEEPDQRLPDGAGPDDVDDVRHTASLRSAW